MNYFNYIKLILILNTTIIFASDVNYQKAQLEAKMVLDKNVFEDLRKYSQLIIDECPTSKCLYISLGRSPIAISLFMQLYYKTEYIVDLPLSNFRLETNSQSSLFTKPNILIPKDKEKLLFNYLETLLRDIPSDLKTVVIFDLVSNGKSLLSAKHLIEKYFEHKKIKLNIIPLALTNPSRNNTVKLVSKIYKVPLPKMIYFPDKSRLYNFMKGSFYENFAPYHAYPALEEGVLETMPKRNISINRIIFIKKMKMIVSKLKRIEAKKCLKEMNDILNLP